MLGQPPQVAVPHVGPDRDYTTILAQTKIVYDQLLADKFGKLLHALMTKKGSFDSQCTKLEQKSKQQALEYGIKAQEYINKMQSDAEEELRALQHDYQSKLTKMADQLEQKWRNEHT